MEFPIILMVGAVLCLGLMILTVFLVFLALRRGSRAIRQGLQERAEEEGNTSVPTNANTRWARGDLKAVSEPPFAEVVLVPCSACGGENPSSAGTCAFCGRKL